MRARGHRIRRRTVRRRNRGVAGRADQQRRRRDRDRGSHRRAHTALIKAGVDAGIPVFCEKPLSGSSDEAIAVADYVNASGVPVQIGYPRRFDPAYLAARDAVVSGELGWLHTLRSTTLDPAPAPRGYIAVSAGSSATARSTTSTPCGGPGLGSSRSTPPADRRDDFFAELGDVATANLLTFDDGATASCPRPLPPRVRRPARAARHRDSVVAGWTENTPYATSSLGPAGRPESPGRSSWTDSTHSAPSSPRSPKSLPGNDRRHAPSTTRSP